MKRLLKDPKLAIILLHCATVAVIILSLSVVKALGGNVYTQFKTWYKENFEANTSVNEVLQNNEIIEQNETAPNVVITNTSIKIEKEKETASLNEMIWPVTGLVTSEFGGRADPFTNAPSSHQGIDIAVESGTSVLAVMSGVVSEVGYEVNGYGNFVVIKHSDKFETLYAHCNKITVKEGEEVSAGECVGKSGSTGKSTGPHLHFETIVGGTSLNPRWFLSK